MVGALCLVQFVDVLGVTVVVTALPVMLADLGAPPSSGAVVVTAYAMFFGGLLMLGARLGDRFGHRRAITAGLAVFAVASLLGALAGSILVLAAARCLQGAAAAASVPSALRLLTTLTAEGPARRRAIAAWSAAGAAAGASGFVIGGIVTDLTSWRVIFWAYLPLAAALAAVILRAVPRDRDREAPGPLDAAGSVTLTAAVMAVIAGTTLLAQHGHRLPGGGLIVVAAALAAGFILIERRAARPVMPGAALRLPALRRGAAGALLNTATTSPVMTLATLYLQVARHDSPLRAGLSLLPFSLAVIAGSALAAPALHRIAAHRVIAAGLTLIAAGDGSLIAAARTRWGLPACVALAGLGIGLSSVAATTLGTDVPATWRGTAAGIINTVAQLGSATGIAALLLVAALTTGTTGHGSAGPVIAWAAAAAIAGTGALAFAIQRQPGLQPAAQTPLPRPSSGHLDKRASP